MSPARLAAVGVTLFIMTSSPGSAERCAFLEIGPGVEHRANLTAFVEAARRSCQPGQTMEIRAMRGVFVSPDLVASLVCEGSAFDEIYYTGSPWAGRCRLRRDMPPR